MDKCKKEKKKRESGEESGGRGKASWGTEEGEILGAESAGGRKVGMVGLAKPKMKYGVMANIRSHMKAYHRPKCKSQQKVGKTFCHV